jgi:transposase InsO family protein
VELFRVAEPIAHCGELGRIGGRGRISDCRVRPVLVVVGDPASGGGAGVAEAKEQGLVQEFNRKKTQRLYGEEGLAVRRRKSRRRIAVARTPIPRPEGPNSRWSTDFVHDQLANGRRFWVLTIIDDVTRECLAAVPDTSLSGKRVVREMQALIARRGKPGMIISDNGTEFTSSAVLAFTQVST